MAQDGSRGSAEVVLIGGQIASGKTVAANSLATAGSAEVVVVREVLQGLLRSSMDWDRKRLQQEGAALDRRTNGRWLMEHVQSVSEGGGRWVIDAARTRRQAEPLLENIGGSRLIYLSASEATRRSRFSRAQATDPVKRSLSFDDAMAHATEGEAANLRAMAHLVLETDDLNALAVVTEIRNFLRW